MPTMTCGDSWPSRLGTASWHHAEAVPSRMMRQRAMWGPEAWEYKKVQNDVKNTCCAYLGTRIYFDTPICFCKLLKKMSSDPLANFSCMDELVQVIYQSIYKFVVLSTVSHDEWHVHLGLAGSEGRWWHGSWKNEDIHHIFVCIYSLSSTKGGWRLGSPVSSHHARVQHRRINCLNLSPRSLQMSSYKANYV